MKKLHFPRLFSFVFILALSLVLDSCKKEDNPDLQPTTAAIEGSYKISALKVSPKALGQFDDLLAATKLIFNNTTCLTDLTITFKTGGDATTDNPAACMSIPVPLSTFTGVDASSKWARNGDKLTITKGDGTKTEYTVLNTGSTMTLQWQGVLNYPVPSPTIYTYTMDLKKQ